MLRIKDFGHTCSQGSGSKQVVSFMTLALNISGSKAMIKSMFMGRSPSAGSVW